ncbi:CocE/NonD family hydrolase [Nocardia niwae]|uniref:CocE/NonD family hydrolase n=1 Tax=Nocardia niwae TaxID=626084 RepID=A0ABV2X6X5_9NOCA|nr:CocE/NonD family hydrolase [Nocardia niwae]
MKSSRPERGRALRAAPESKSVLPLWTRFHARRARLPKPTPWRMRTVRIPTRANLLLGADLYTPVTPSKGVLVAFGPYGRGAPLSIGFARAFAGQGYTVLFVSSRGTADSEGDLDPIRTDAEDYQDIVAWLREQLWYPGRFGTIGSSYLGYTQWALMSDPPPDLAAAVVTMGPHDFSRHVWGSGSFRFDILEWSADVGAPDDPNPLRGWRTRSVTRKRVGGVVAGVPLLPAAEEFFTAAGRAWVLDRLRRDDIGDPFWAPEQHTDALDISDVPTLIFAGWQDVFLSQSVRQYARLRERGADVALTVGAWTHIDILLRGQPVIGPETLDWLDTHLADRDTRRRRAPVRVQVGAEQRWLELSEWPPAGAFTTLHLHPDRRLTAEPPGPDAAPASFLFDPARPTPTIGGNLLNRGGYRDDTAYAERDDVLVYDSEPLQEELRLLGAPSVLLTHSSERRDADVFVRVSDVDRRGRSRAVTETYRRWQGTGPLALTLNDSAYLFRAGHRVRLIVAGGSFPQFSRNPGTGENPLTAAVLHPNRHHIQHANGASVLRLPNAEHSQRNIRAHRAD